MTDENREYWKNVAGPTNAKQLAGFTKWFQKAVDEYTRQQRVNKQRAMFGAEFQTQVESDR